MECVICDPDNYDFLIIYFQIFSVYIFKISVESLRTIEYTELTSIRLPVCI